MKLAFSVNYSPEEKHKQWLMQHGTHWLSIWRADAQMKSWLIIRENTGTEGAGARLAKVLTPRKAPSTPGMAATAVPRGGSKAGIQDPVSALTCWGHLGKSLWLHIFSNSFLIPLPREKMDTPVPNTQTPCWKHSLLVLFCFFKLQATKSTAFFSFICLNINKTSRRWKF